MKSNFKMIATCLASTFFILLPCFALAHITMEPKSAPAGDYAKIIFRVPHGCEGSPTTKITVQIPEGVLSVKPQVHAGWTIALKKVKLAKPASLHGEVINETISEVTWQGGPLPDEHMDEFGMSLKLPDRAGKRLAFLIHQGCEKGEIRWVEVGSAEHSHEAGKFPAPSLLLEKSQAHAGHHEK